MPVSFIEIGRRIYFENLPFSFKDEVKALGAKWDGDKRQWWVSSAKRVEADQLIAWLEANPKPENPHDVRIIGKVRYKGRVYFIRGENQGRCRLTTLDGKVDFWTEQSDCELIRTYQPREVRIGFRGQMRTEYTTLGSLRAYAERQHQAKADGLHACQACGKRGPLVEDLEDGAMKCHGCCDIPSSR